MKGMRIKQVTIVVACILLIPLVLTLLNPSSHIRGGQGGGWDWNPIGIIPIGAFLFVVGLAIDFADRKIKSPVYRVLTISVIISAVLFLWFQIVSDGEGIQLLF